MSASLDAPFQLFLLLSRHWGLASCSELPGGGHSRSPGCCCLPGAAIALTCHAFNVTGNAFCSYALRAQPDGLTDGQTARLPY